MQSPFPGMDPYLEEPALWPDVHHEFLSVAREFLNRQLRPNGRANYEEKRREVMTSACHFVEIDLLRAGDHLHTREVLPAAEYYVHVSRRGLRPKGFVRPVLLPQRLPAIGIPLKDEHQDAVLDLQRVLSTAYERSAYDLRIDYRAEPNPRLPAEYQEWAKSILSH